MIRLAMNRATSILLLSHFVLLLLLASAGCHSFKPGLPQGTHFHHRHLNQSDADFSVTVSVPARPDLKHVFDRHLDHKGIQPVWISIENRRTNTAYLLPHALDSAYFAPLEIAYQHHKFGCRRMNAALDAFFLTNALPASIPPRSTRSGYVFTHQSLGRKKVKVMLADEEDIVRGKSYTFHAEIPGLQAEHKSNVVASVMSALPPIDCDDERLRHELQKLPRATTSRAGRSEGDPLNLVVIGTVDDLSAFVDCGWTLTERLTFGSAWRTLKSTLFRQEYHYSPISHLYHAGRPQDISFQKVRSSIKQRNHLRLWVTPLRYKGKPVWIGQVSRDIGVRWTWKTPTLTTHKINPNIDETRSYLVQDLAPNCRWWSHVKGVEPAPPASPRRNLTGDPYFTDGLRVVMELTCEPTSEKEPTYRRWEAPHSISIGNSGDRVGR